MSVALQIAIVIGYLLPLAVVGSLARGTAPVPRPIRVRHSRARR